MHDLPDRLKLIRGKLSQSVFSAKIGIAQRTWSRYESGESTPDFKTAQGICSKLSIEPKWLLFGEGPMRAGDIVDLHEPCPESIQPGRCPHCTKSEKMADDLRSELSKERDMNRELVAENRQLWKENGELKAEVSTLRAEARAAPTPAESNRRIA